MQRIGFTLPQFGSQAQEGGEVARFAREAERLGADSLWVGDRLLAPVDPSVGYAGGDAIPEVFRSALDPFALLSVAAAVTERPLIGANVLNAPWYAPAVLARSLTTIDQLSGGRLLPGFGTGWSPEEYEASGVPMRQRGARLDECLDALGELWSHNPAEYRGTHWTVPATYADLKPVQQPRPPIYLAGFAPAAIARVARRADGWLPVHVPGRGAFDPEAVNTVLGRIRELAAAEGRTSVPLGAVLRISPATDTPLEDVVDTIMRAERDTDIRHCFVELMNAADSVDQALEIADAVLRRVRG
ncbi:TIGR03619 family F420-dependent LLM class oxidoreductase [Saccharopolyspora sp. HNM0983]|uniref:TIGR03619 family F420-dependent LLM class oxidoreductase n=1 Tax=Saccharopolyspora montiporae TaxID=2781240 RepID=A0A929FYY2_9PSEU|nr:TIGR03619 family F420-dependent LLM class oxidoreductase [Saccharopolyspora sp. HNM0983]MBE9373824.1 TIGR03619 family F420-dependent LLM class oxidoreductase [Saccharopolyspora sp. HNM0983]